MFDSCLMTVLSPNMGETFQMFPRRASKDPGYLRLTIYDRKYANPPPPLQKRRLGIDKLTSGHRRSPILRIEVFPIVEHCAPIGGASAKLVGALRNTFKLESIGPP